MRPAPGAPSFASSADGAASAGIYADDTGGYGGDSETISSTLTRGGAVTVTTAPADHNTASLLWGYKWNTTNLTYSFPTASSQYGTGQGTGAGQYNSADPFTGFSTLSANQQTYVKRAFSMLSSFTQLTFTEITETNSTHANIRLANSSSSVNNTAHAYPIGDVSNGEHANGTEWGDVWYGGTGRNPTLGNFDNGQSTMHEIGHALGLKHGQNNFSFGVMNADRLDIEYSDMNYPNYIGQPAGGATAGPGSSEQTYQMYDIAALQYLYGANYSKVGTNVTYTWSPTTGEWFINGVGQGVPQANAQGIGNIFDTIWTAGATSTIDISNFNTNGTLDLRPGNGLMFSSAQRADLGYYSAQGAGAHMATYNVYNSLDFNGNTASEIDNLKTGNGNNTIYGNGVFNTFTLGNGTDVVHMGTAGGVVYGGSGYDTFYGSSARSYYGLGAGSYSVQGGGGDNLYLATLTGTGTISVDYRGGTVYDGSQVRAQFYGVSTVTTGGRTSSVTNLGKGVGVYCNYNTYVDATGANAGQDYINVTGGYCTVKVGNAQGADLVNNTGGYTTLDLSGLTGSGSLGVYLGYGYASYGNTNAVSFAGVQQFQGGNSSEYFVGQNSGTQNIISLGNYFDYYIGGAVGNQIVAGAGNAVIQAGSGSDAIFEYAAAMTAGHSTSISNFHIYDGANGTYLFMPSAYQSSTSFADVSGGTFIATALAGGGTWNAFVSGVSSAQVQAQTVFGI